MTEKELKIKRLRQKLNKLELEDIDLHTYQSNISLLNPNDVGPVYEENSSEYSQTLSQRIEAIDQERQRLSQELKRLEESQE